MKSGQDKQAGSGNGASAEAFFLGGASTQEQEIVFTDDPVRPPSVNSVATSTDSSKSSRKSLAQRFGLSFRNRSSTLSDDEATTPKRRTHLQRLLIRRKAEHRLLESGLVTGRDESKGSSIATATLASVVEEGAGDDAEILEDAQRIMEDSHTKELSNTMKKINEMLAGWVPLNNKLESPLEVRMVDFSYTALIQPGANKVKTVFNSSFLYDMKKLWKRVFRGEEPEAELPIRKVILDKINLVIEPGKSYLILGPPQSGKTSLLRAISGHVRKSKRKLQQKNQTIEGKILYNGKSLEEGGTEFHIENAIEYIDQLDCHAPRLTVEETFEFAYQCKSGGTLLREKQWLETDKEREFIAQADRERLRVKATLVGLGLDGVKDTFVGDTNIRGVSGGQRRRVTVGEMMQDRIPVICGDEISTGLDATSTYETVELLTHFAKRGKTCRVISLLQPSPETVSLFDEVILLSEGRIIYSGPILEVESYFQELGYKAPKHIDIADFLQQVSTDGAEFFTPSPEHPNPLSSHELARAFVESGWGKLISEKLKTPPMYSWAYEEDGSGGSLRKKQIGASPVAEMMGVKHKYANGFFRNTHLNTRRFLTLWLRDKRVIIAGAAKNILMGVSVGGVFANTTEEIDLVGALFQAGLFIMLGAMQNASSLIADRPVFKKHFEANFYSAAPFVIGRSISSVPQTVSDVCMFGTLLYYIVGLAGRDDAGNFFIFLATLICFAFTMQQQLAVFASFSTTSGLQVLSAITLLYFILFGGFIVAPDTIPDFYLWAYWINPYAWANRALVINEFSSDRWEDPDEILIRLGYTLPRSNEAYSTEWIGWSFLFMGLYYILCTILCAVGLTLSGEKVVSKTLQFDDKPATEGSGQQEFHVPFVPVTLSFHDISYEVTASTGSDKLRLLNNVNGLFKPGRMTALMGTSGAGKTTLMDVIALRKRSGEVTGDVRLNGWPQDPISFRRATGYVEQFDVQTPQLTVKETVLFSARLRLSQDFAQDEAEVDAFVDVVLAAVGLESLHCALVGTDDGMGLSFEQKKLLSIAVELAASPSIIFLDEPTSGLDSRSAMKVVETLRKISNEGRTIIATIHQPSSAVFEMFDDLLLLKRGGNVVFHGELGDSSSKLVKYFKSEGAPKIQFGENPANWMLTVMARDDMQDLEERWLRSSNFAEIKQELASIYTNRPDDGTKVEFEEEFAAPRRKRRDLITKRLRLIYWRSPGYNLARLTVSATIAFVLGSVFILKRGQTLYSETDMRARFSVIFLAFIITGIMAILSTVPVMTNIRDMFHRHRASATYDSASIGWALGSAEKLFIVLSSAVFCIIFQTTGSLNDSFYRGMVGFWGFFTFNFAIYSYFGQAFVSLVEPSATAIILSSVFIGLNNFFAGLIVRPQLMVGGFYALPFYICPGHYVYEGMIISLYREDNSEVIADEGSDFWDFLGCTESPCTGSLNQYIDVFFGGVFHDGHIARNGLVLGFILVTTRVLTWVALKYIRFG
mmetsp:Transcript_4399/g.11080  ORF Transcript_4399/g.11080 Transcript_4399/m.11080 type:complete len:1493 (+) Transcript_4399:44-4522(+)